MTTSADTSGEPITPSQAVSDGSRALQVDGATRRLGTRLVLDDVCLHVARGEAVAVVGPNGAGKTSLLRAIGGRLRLDRGQVRIDGRSGDVARREGRLGVVPQELALYAHLTVRENLAVLGRLAGVRRIDLAARVEDALTAAGLHDRAAAPVHTLSGGMRRRVNLVAATLHRPALVLLDEPTVGVDEVSRDRLHDGLRRLCELGTALVLTTHDLEEAAAVCRQVVVLNQGRIVAAGSAEALIESAFGHAGELLVTADGSEGATVLRAEGFVARADGAWLREWPAEHGLASIEQRLQSAGVRVSAMQWRRPTLAGAVARLIARQPQTQLHAEPRA